MSRLETWYGRPTTVLCLLLALAALTVVVGTRLTLGQGKSGGRESQDVVIEHYGVDADEVERTITVPLESELAGLEGVAALRSVSEFGKSRVTVEWTQETDAGQAFVALGDVVARVAAGLPRSVQKPRIVTSSGDQGPSFIAALEAPGRSLDELRDWVEREVKPPLEKLEGVGEVEVAGGEVKEVHVLVDEGRAASVGLGFDALAGALQGQDALLPAGTLVKDGQALSLSVQGRLVDLDALRSVRVPLPAGGNLPLGSLAEVRYGGREADTVSRLDGHESVVLLVHSAGSANLIGFSRQMRQAMDRLAAQGVASQVILDEGKKLEEALWGTIRALLEGLAVVLVVLPWVLPRVRSLVAVAVILPLSMAATLAVLTGLGVLVDRFVLAGFAVGLGALLDYVLLVSRARTTALADLGASLATGLGTTLLFLVPLGFLDFVWPGIRTLVLAVGLLLVLSFGFSMLFLPVLQGKVTPKRPFRWRWGLRSLGFVVRLSCRHPRFVLGVSAALVAVAGVTLAAGVNLGGEAPGDELGVHVEFESEASVASVDRRLGPLVAELRQVPAIVQVESVARQGSAELTIRWDRARLSRSETADLVRAKGRSVAGAFLYVPEGGSAHDTAVTVTLSGDDNQRLRALAHRAASALQGTEGVGQVILNFKDPPRRLEVVVDPVKAAHYGLTAAQLATDLRWKLYGPVAVKWQDQGRERDLRLRGAHGPSATRERLMALPVGPGASRGQLSSVATLVEAAGGAKVYHEGRQRVVYLTVHTSLASAPRIASTLEGALKSVALPPGYAFRIDPRIFEAEANFSLVAGALGLSLVLIGLVLAARSQSFTAPLLTLAMVPVALSFPVCAQAWWGGGVSVPVLLGLVLVGGTIVNNAILVVDSAGGPPFRAVRRRLGPLLMTNGTAVLGALPLALTGGGVTASLALLVFWGAVGALATTLTTVPALLSLFPRGLDPVYPTPSKEISR